MHSSALESWAVSLFLGSCFSALEWVTAALPLPGYVRIKLCDLWVVPIPAPGPERVHVHWCHLALLSFNFSL